jgi:hypothetical protein
MTSHSFKTIAGLALVFIVGAGSAIGGGWSAANIITMLVAGLLALEHALNGNTGGSSSIN